MQSTAIFLPAMLLMLWTLTVLLLVPIRRVRAVMQQRLTPQDFSHGESANVPPDVALPNRVFMNLLEVPVLFYGVVFMAYHPGGLAKRESLGGAPPSPPPPAKPMHWQEAEAAAERLRRLGVDRVRAV